MLTQTRDQRRAGHAFDHVSAIAKGSKEAEEYGRYAHKLPVLIRQAGLAQALAFADAKSGPGGKRLLDDLAEHLHTLRLLPSGSRDALLATSRQVDLTTYMLLTREATSALNWYKRFSQSVLEIDASQDDD